MLARTAALKLIHPRGESPIEIAQLQRFEREVQTTARLRSPHTIEIYDYGFTGDGTFYYVMELLAGLDLDDFLRKYGPMPDGRVIWILRQVCHSLGEAHELGLVHRDVKPANIFLCKAGRDFDVAKVLDFGLVKRTRDAFAEDEHLTVHGAFYGTPLYASPEMARGDVDLADARTDIYSLACVAYWLLTGRTVFAGDTPMAVLVKHTSAEPDPPSRHSAQQISTGLDDVILRCLAKEPAARPDADELLALLGKVEPLQEWDERRARDWWATTNPSVPSTTPSGPRPGEGTLVTPEGASR
jgi:serine/threonine-protein kinase